MSFKKIRLNLEIEYAKKVAMAEVLDFKQGIIKRKISDYKLYNNDLELNFPKFDRLHLRLLKLQIALFFVRLPIVNKIQD